MVRQLFDLGVDPQHIILLGDKCQKEIYLTKELERKLTPLKKNKFRDGFSRPLQS